jgi:CheY-like chemotaxis protein
MTNKNNVEAALVLVVEDEPLVRLSAADMIEDLGYAVIEAASADEAMSILESRDDITIVFTDVNMPGSMDGLKLAHVIRHRWPPVHLVVASGRHRISNEELPLRGRFLSKPYQYSDIARTLQQLVTE